MPPVYRGGNRQQYAIRQKKTKAVALDVQSTQKPAQESRPRETDQRRLEYDRLYNKVKTAAEVCNMFALNGSDIYGFGPKLRHFVRTTSKSSKYDPSDALAASLISAHDYYADICAGIVKRHKPKVKKTVAVQPQDVELVVPVSNNKAAGSS